MDYQRLIISGTVAEDAARRSGKKSQTTYTVFSLKVAQRNAQPQAFPVMVYGKLGESLARYLTRGRTVLVEGKVKLTKAGRCYVLADQIILGAPVK